MPSISDILNPAVSIESAVVNAVKAPLSAMGVGLPEPPIPPPASFVMRQIGGQSLPELPNLAHLLKLPGMPEGAIRLPNFPGVTGAPPVVEPPKIRIGMDSPQQPPPGVAKYVIGWSG